MDRTTLLRRLTGVLFAPVLWTVPLLLVGCSSTSQDEYHTVTEADTVDESKTTAAPIPSPSEETFDTAPPASAGTPELSLDDPLSVDPEPLGSPLSEAGGNSASDPKSAATTNSQAAVDPLAEVNNSVTTTTPGDTKLPDSSPSNTVPTVDVARPIKLLVPKQTFSVEGPEGALRISYDDFDLEKVLNVTIPPPDIVKHFPNWLNDLDGKRVRVRGFMYPTFQETDLGGFVLARDYGVCCFGPQGKIYHLVEVAMRDGESTDYIHARPFDVVGEFHIRPDSDGEELLQLYQIEDAIVVDQ